MIVLALNPQCQLRKNCISRTQYNKRQLNQIKRIQGIQRLNIYTDINRTPKGILKSPKSKSPEFNKRNTSKSNNTLNKGDKCFKSQKKSKPKVTFEILDNLF